MLLVELSIETMVALLEGDLETARARTGVSLSEYLTGPDASWLWRIRIDQVRRDPASAGWIARAAVDERTGQVVGHAGFHGPPDPAGRVEVGYSVDPGLRRRGYGRQMLAELLRRAEAEPDVTTVRASVRPDNAASLALVAAAGFERVGEQWDDEDGLELVFERPARA